MPVSCERSLRNIFFQYDDNTSLMVFKFVSFCSVCSVDELTANVSVIFHRIKKLLLVPLHPVYLLWMIILSKKQMFTRKMKILAKK